MATAGPSVQLPDNERSSTPKGNGAGNLPPIPAECVPDVVAVGKAIAKALNNRTPEQEAAHPGSSAKAIAEEVDGEKLFECMTEHGRLPKWPIARDGRPIS